MTEPEVQDAKIRELGEKTLLRNPMAKCGVGGKKAAHEVPIDKTTTIPHDLYMDLMRAGERAKNAGQHQLKGHRVGKPRLVIMD